MNHSCIRRFYEVASGAQCPRPFFVASLGRAGENKDWDTAEPRLFTHPRQHFETAQKRQLQIEQYQCRKRECLAICVLAAAAEIVDSLLPIRSKVDRV